MIAISEMDSARFGLVVARAAPAGESDLEPMLGFCADHDVDLVIARCDAADSALSRALRAAGLESVEGQIVYRGPACERPSHPGIRPAVAGDEEAIATLAARGFDEYGGHYFSDPRLPAELCKDLYVDWARRGASGEAADEIVVAEHGGGVAAFGMWTISGDEVTFQLAAVAPEARRLGLYTALTLHGQDWAHRQGAKSVIGIVAHATLGSHRMFSGAGWRPEQASTTFHGWRDRMAAAQPVANLSDSAT
ncbi:MAG: GNAT family N-acetyltransferase [Solirubrobacteraceae bacterium]